MMRRLWIALAGGFSLSWTVSAADELREIRSGLNALHQVQDEIARGSADSSPFQKVILDRVTESFERLPEAQLATPEGQLALAELALSGGERDRVGKIIRQSQNKHPHSPLLAGVDAYLSADMRRAAEALEQAQTSADGASSADHFIALAKGTALLDGDMPKARKAFEQALIDAPGTLVEEVAVRRLTSISLQQRDPGLFMRCANLYLRRYRNSPFAREFLTGFVEGALLVTSHEDMERLANLAALLPAPTGRPLLEALTANLLAQGKIELAKVLATHLRALAGNDGMDPERTAEFQLLDMLIQMGGASQVHFLPALQNLDGEPMQPGILPLLDVARHVAWNIHRPLALPAGERPGEAAEDSNMSHDFADVDRTLAQAKSVLDRLGTSHGTSP